MISHGWASDRHPNFGTCGVSLPNRAALHSIIYTAVACACTCAWFLGSCPRNGHSKIQYTSWTRVMQQPRLPQSRNHPIIYLTIYWGSTDRETWDDNGLCNRAKENAFGRPARNASAISAILQHRRTRAGLAMVVFTVFNREGGILGGPYQPPSFNTRSLWLPNAGSGVANMDGMLAKLLLNRAVERVNLTHLFAWLKKGRGEGELITVKARGLMGKG